jgi:CRP/FNR family transcriptional regulator, nitrogen fixation regulation protein
MTQLALTIDRPVTIPPDRLAGWPWVQERARGGFEPTSGVHAAGPVQYFTRDRDIYGEGEDAALFFKVVSGVVRTCKFLSDGRRQIESFHFAGDVFGLEAGPEHTLGAEAVCDCAVVSYRRRGLETLAENDGALSRQIFSFAMRSLARSQKHALLLGCGTAVEKVAAFLVELAAAAPESTAIALAMTRQDIADYLGLTMETVSRTLSRFERDGLIELPTARQVWIKNLAALRNLNR